LKRLRDALQRYDQVLFLLLRQSVVSFAILGDPDSLTAQWAARFLSFQLRD
jgi:hypothetical protein